MKISPMKMLKNLFFTIIFLVGCSLTGFGQSDDNRNPPPKKGEQPKIMIVPKNDGQKPKDPPRDNDSRQETKPKKTDDEDSEGDQ